MNRDIEESRERLAAAVRDARYALNIPRRIQRSFQRQPAVWIIGAVVVGAVVMMIPRKKVVYVADDKSDKKRVKSRLLQSGLLLGAARLAATLLKPVLLNIVRQRINSGISRSAGRSRD